MLMNGRHLSFNKMWDLLPLQMIVHMNESSTANILYFEEVSNIAGVHIKMDTSKEKLINVNIEEEKFIHFKSCSEGLLYTNLNDPTRITNTTNIPLNAYSYLYRVKKNSEFLLILKLKECRKLESYSNIFTGRESQNLRLTYEKE